MAMIRTIQWLISVTVLIYGVALLREMGLTALLFVGVGLFYCALAAWAARLTILPLLVAAIANIALAWASWRMWVGELESVAVNAEYRGHKATFADYLTLDGIASSVILLLLAGYFGAVIQWARTHPTTTTSG